MILRWEEVISMPSKSRNVHMENAKKLEQITGKQKKAAIGRLLNYVFKYYKLRLVLILIFLIFASSGGVIGSFFVGQITSLVSEVPVTPDTFDWGTFYLYIGLLGGSYALAVIGTYMYNRMMVVVGQGVMKRIRDDLFTHMIDLPVPYFDSRTHGDIMSVYTNDVDTLSEMISRVLPMVTQSALTMVAVFIVMLATSWILSFVVILFAVIILLLTIYFARSSSKYFIKQQGALGATDGYIEEMISGQKVIKVFNYEEKAEEGFDELNDALFVSARKAQSYASILMPAVNQLGNVQYALLGLFGGLMVANHVPGISFGIIVSFLLYSKAFTQPIGQVSQQMNIIALAIAGSVRIFEMIDEPKEIDEGYVELVNAKEGPNGEIIETQERTHKWAWKHPHHDGHVDYKWLQGKIDFYDVDFAYVPGKTILHDISLYAKPGQKIAFVGPTGAGKTTITNLINRFYDIEDGKIRYDDINISKIKKDDLRRSLGIVLQDVKLFTGTVMENIRYGRLDATDEEVYAAAKLANADSFIRLLPDGYNTVLHNAGMSLSQGQRQLISIARAAVADPPVMILDEATSSIDSRTEALVQEGMDRIMKGRTVFVIAHRLSTIKNSDVIMVLEGGRIIERGTHDDLIAKQGKYYQLYTGNAAKYIS